ncbi:hypothetical protein BESB_045140 [Besnoitia besnoiti]|uniref:Uncharacterized protein n=1 Tax=Besnoitia besnoiti TaxID=94643 RepID=A0A2A9MLI8_BESBE|nr:hypothetical protein BESB_045140 [Besnoitia besnoiti]PFH36322.1 hypothetical protein BESB_045140 [Besnoitia besnoiti]
MFAKNMVASTKDQIRTLAMIQLETVFDTLGTLVDVADANEIVSSASILRGTQAREEVVQRLHAWYKTTSLKLRVHVNQKLLEDNLSAEELKLQHTLYYYATEFVMKSMFVVVGSVIEEVWKSEDREHPLAEAEAALQGLPLAAPSPRV